MAAINYVCWPEPGIVAAGLQLRAGVGIAFEKLPLDLSVSHLGCLFRIFAGGIYRVISG